MWTFDTRVIDGRTAGFLVMDEHDSVICSIPRAWDHNNKVTIRTQAQCEAIAREITSAHNDRNR